MNIYKVSRTDKWSYDDYSDFVVIAEDEKTALHTGPNGKTLTFLDGDDWDWGWVSSPMFLTVELIGTAAPGAKPGIVLASFHAG